MRSNDKVLLENVNDYFTHKGMPLNLSMTLKKIYVMTFKNLKKSKIILILEGNQRLKLS